MYIHIILIFILLINIDYLHITCDVILPSHYVDSVLIQYIPKDNEKERHECEKALYLTAPKPTDSDHVSVKLEDLSIDYMPKGSMYIGENVGIAWGNGDYQIWNILSNNTGLSVRNMANPSIQLDLIQISDNTYQIPIQQEPGKFYTVDHVMNDRLIAWQNETWESHQQWHLLSFPPKEYLMQCYYIESNRHPDLYITISHESTNSSSHVLGSGRSLEMKAMKRNSDIEQAYQLWFPEFDSEHQWTFLHSAIAPDCVLDIATTNEQAFIWPCQGSSAWHQQWNIDQALNNCSWGPIFCDYGSDPLYLYASEENEPLERYPLSIISPLNSSAKWKLVKYFDHDQALIVIPPSISDPYSYDDYCPQKLIPIS